MADRGRRFLRNYEEIQQEFNDIDTEYFNLGNREAGSDSEEDSGSDYDTENNDFNYFYLIDNNFLGNDEID